MTRNTLLALCAAFLTGALAGHSLRTPPPAVRVPNQVVEQLCARVVGLRAVQPAAEGLLSSVYLTTTNKTWDELACLPWSPAAAPRWRGTIVCKRVPPGCELVDRDPEHLLTIANLVIYGDPELLRKIAEVLR
jgi:hypothetical protein